MILFLLLATVLADQGLVDHPIESCGARTYLDNSWTVSTMPPATWDDVRVGASALNITIQATVPGDLITDLHRAKVIGDPWFERNWIANSSLWSDHAWYYSTLFTVGADVLASTSAQLLVFDGVKMGATIKVNGHTVGVVRDQFLRYVFELNTSVLLAGKNANQLGVSFGVEDVTEDGRFMACTGGWDWAPYSYTTKKTYGNTAGPVPTFSKGIWKSVYLTEVPRSTVAITHLTPHTKYKGEYPVSPLKEGAHGGFSVNITVHVWAPMGGATGSITVMGSWVSSGGAMAVADSGLLRLPVGDSSVSLQLMATAKQIRLWWPTGVGDQPLYNVKATWSPKGLVGGDGEGTATVSAERRMGFRVFALVTTNDTDPAVRANTSAEGSGTHGMFFRVNGAAIYSRGGNMVPMEELEGRLDGEAHRILVKSSADVGMNTLRVWGGGIFFPDEFYDACDEYGVLVYHDMQYANKPGVGHGPTATATQDAELRYQIRRLSHHPAIVLWDGANEVIFNSTSAYATFVMTVVAQEDQSRVIWPASPAAGWITGVHTLYGTPNNSPQGLTLSGKGQIWNTGIETHGPYQLGGGWPTVNGGISDTCFDNYLTGNQISTPNDFKGSAGIVTGGVTQKNQYASEFGTSGSSSFESMSATLAPEHWGVQGGMAADSCTGPDECIGQHTCTGKNPMTERNYACTTAIKEYFGDQAVDVSATGIKAFQGQTYQCQLAQAFVMKQNFEHRRSSNVLGHITWMLNEIWPTVGWGSLEYGPPAGFTPGQVRGGRWKPLHYFFKHSLMADVMATCGSQDQCWIKNDRASLPFKGTVTLTAYDYFGDGSSKVVLHQRIALPPGPGVMTYLTLPKKTTLPPSNVSALISTVHGEEGELVSEHLVQLGRPNITVPKAKISHSISDVANSDGTIDIIVASDKVALWVTLTTLAQGRFSDNAFFLPATSKTVQFVPFSTSTAKDDLATLKASLRVEDYSMYAGTMPAPPTPTMVWV